MASPDCFHRLAHRVALASTLCPLKSECLEQSLFILWWMRRQGVLSEMYLGALQLPFRAHAWVESNGVPVNDHPDRLAYYGRFERRG
jgi:Transglutaminase-like superfamily